MHPIGQTPPEIPKILLFLLLTALFTGACSSLIGREATASRAHGVDLGDAASVHVTIEATAGDLVINGGASRLLEANFRYNREELNPVVRYRVDGGQGELSVSNRINGNEISGEIDGAWMLRFAEGVPLDFDIDHGMGDVSLDLGRLSVGRLHLQNGAGNTTIDLRGVRQHDLIATLARGFGDITLTVPENVPARITIDRRLGAVIADGFQVDGAHYLNDAYRVDADVTLQIHVQSGTGDVILCTAP